MFWKMIAKYKKLENTRSGAYLAPPEGLRAPELLVVNPGGRPQESEGDSKAI